MLNKLNKIKYNLQNKKAFTLFEVVLSLIIFSMFVGIIFTTYINIKKAEGEIGSQQLITSEANDFLDRLHDLSLNYTIDYEEYFNRHRYSQSLNSSERTTGYFTEYGNTGGDLSSPGLYYCASGTTSHITSSGYYIKKFDVDYDCEVLGKQNYGQYKRTFRDTVDQYLNNGNDVFLGEGPIAIMENTGVQELYLINNDGDHRIFFRRKMITGVDLNGDTLLTGINEKLYTIQILKLRGFDAGTGHDFDTDNWGVYDGFVDTRACDLEAGFVCTGASVGNGEYSGYKLPLDIDDGRVNITDPKITISDWNFEIYPAKDPYLATNETGYLVDPFIKVSLTTNLYGVQSTDELTLQTSIGFKNSYSHFDMEILPIPEVGETMMCQSNVAIRAGGTENDYGYTIAIDNDGNSYVGGIFSKTGVFGQTELVGSSHRNIFVARVDSTGNFDWVIGSNGGGRNNGRDIVVDSNKNSYIIGIYQWNISFGTCSLFSSGHLDIFLAKISNTGSCIRAKDFGGTGKDMGTAIALDSNNNIYIGAVYDGIENFNDKTIKGSGLFMKLDNNGNSSGEKKYLTGNGVYRIISMALDGDDNVYAIGTFSGTLFFEGTTNTNSGKDDVFVFKINSGGVLQRIKTFGGTGYDGGHGVFLDNNYIYIGGYFSETITISGTNYVSSGDKDIFIMKLDNNGIIQQINTFGGEGKDLIMDITVDNNIYIAGYFTTSFLTIGDTTLINNGNSDGFLVKLNSNLEYLWANNYGGASDDVFYSVSINNSGDIYTAGSFNNSINFANIELISSGNSDIFVAKYSCDGSIPAEEACGNGILDAAEECDDGGYSGSNDGCTDICTIISRTGDCVPYPLTGHKIPNTVTGIIQSCDGVTTGGCSNWLPSTGYSYNETSSTDYCYFVCNTGYNYNSNTNECDPIVPSTGDFVTIWQTDMPGVTADEQLRIPTNPLYSYDYDVDCDNDLVRDATNVTIDYTCSYANTGIYRVRIRGQFPQIYFNNTGDKQKILSISQWGTGHWADMSKSFYGCSNFGSGSISWAIDNPDLSNVTNMYGMFMGASSFNKYIGNWDISNVETLSRMFNGATNFNQELSGRDTSSVTNMYSMFMGASSFNKYIGNWDISSVETLSLMFGHATNFNQELNSRDTSGVISMNYMFNGATSFNQELNSRDTSSVISMNNMFNGATSFNQPLNGRNTSNVTNIASMFGHATNFNQELNSRDTSSVTYMSYMFNGATSFNQLLDSWNITNLENALRMFKDITLSTENYDKLLSGRYNQTHNTGIIFNGGNSKYCTGESARSGLISDGRTIADGGIDPSCP